MLEEMWQGVKWALGLDAETLSVGQMALRAVLVYGAALVLVRLGEKRFIGKNTAFDVILGFILGSVLSRAITSTDAFFAILAAGLVLVTLHWLFAVVSFHSDRMGSLVKGHERTLVRDGEIQWEAMRSSHITEQDLLSALRRNAKLADVSRVRMACLERNGDISVLKEDQEPRIVEVDVKEGVQTVRIEWR